MTRLQSFIVASMIVGVFIAMLFVIDVLRQKPEIPPQVPHISYEDIMLKKKKRKPLDDFCVPCEISFREGQVSL